MAYGYIKGAELSALSYYESLFAQTMDLDTREKINGVVQDLKDILRAKGIRSANEGHYANQRLVGINLASSNLSPRIRESLSKN
jgi:hypothetical protein